jgi:hypothetical protein
MTAADGTFNSATEGIRATIDATGWTPGTYQLYVRAKDSVGNWGNTVTVNLVVTLVDLIFEDGFETGNVSAWSLSSGGANLQVSTTGALVGTYSLRATFVGAQPSFVADNTPANESTYRARFYFNPNGATTTGIQHDILVGRTTGGAGVFTVQYRLSAGALYQVRLGVARAGGTTFTSWFNITNGVGTPIEISWQSAASATIQLYVGGTLRQTLTGLNTSAFLVDQVRLGPQSVAAGMSGTEIFDAFKSTRFTYIGP